jgi:hypothetical protein
METDLGNMLDAIAEQIAPVMAEPGGVASILVVTHGTVEMVDGEVTIRPDATGIDPTATVRVIKAPATE